MNFRIPIAAAGGLIFMAAWIAGAIVLGGAVRGLHPAVEFFYYAAAGLLWVFPVRWLMLWAARMR